MYIAAHGWKVQVGRAPLGELLGGVANVSKACSITGVLLGSCYGGECSRTMEDGLKASDMRWCVGNASRSWWLEGTLMDCSIDEEGDEDDDDDDDEDEDEDDDH